MSEEAGKDAIYAFGPFRLDARTHKVTKKGRSVDLDVKPTQVLLALVERAGKIVSTEELLEIVWGGIAVSDDSFYTHVSVLRKKLGQRRKSNEYILTIPREGYKFVAPVKIVPRTEIERATTSPPDKSTAAGNVVTPEAVASGQNIPPRAVGIMAPMQEGQGRRTEGHKAAIDAHSAIAVTCSSGLDDIRAEEARLSKLREVAQVLNEHVRRLGGEAEISPEDEERWVAEPTYELDEEELDEDGYPYD